MSSNNRYSPLVKLHEIPPREQTGRDVLSRFEAQHKAAGLASLEILDNQLVDRVFCEWHDDFVVRKVIDDKVFYHFFQVKTKKKQNHQWSLMELIGVDNIKRVTDSAEVISDSFTGKLLAHTVNFYDTCEKVVFLTNIYVKDQVDELLEAIQKDNTNNKAYAKLLAHFKECFCSGQSIYTESEIKALLSKLAIEQGAEHIKVKDDQFESIAKNKIYEFSEIDLQHNEAIDILESLLTLIKNKSTGELPDDLNEKMLDRYTGIGLDDLLKTLSLSKIAYQSFIDSGDSKALKNLSILQRILKQTSTPSTMVDFAAKCKTDWDIWFRNNRHDVPEYEMNLLENKLSEAIKETVISGNIFLNMEKIVTSITSYTSTKDSLNVVA